MQEVGDDFTVGDVLAMQGDEKSDKMTVLSFGQDYSWIKEIVC